VAIIHNKTSTTLNTKTRLDADNDLGDVHTSVCGSANCVGRSRAGEGSLPVILGAGCFLSVAAAAVFSTYFAEAQPPALPSEPEPGCPESPGETHSYWYIGVAMSCVSCLANSFGYNLVRYAHVEVAARKTAGDFGARASQIPWFFVGWALSIVVCAGLDTIALTFTAPELLGPLSGVTLVLNTWVAQLINGERVFALDGAVTVLILTGVVTTILNGPTGTLVRVDEHFLWAALHRPAVRALPGRLSAFSVP
jgi:hypothetical protein